LTAESEEAKAHYLPGFLLFCATAGKIFARRSRTTLLLATLNVLRPVYNSSARRSRTTSSSSALVVHCAVDCIQREKAKTHHHRLLFISCSRHGKQELSEKKQNHMMSLFAGMPLIAFSLLFTLNFPQHSIKASEFPRGFCLRRRSRITSPPNAASVVHTATRWFAGWYQQLYAFCNSVTQHITQHLPQHYQGFYIRFFLQIAF
jgi:hypothetical protein